MRNQYCNGDWNAKVGNQHEYPVKVSVYEKEMSVEKKWSISAFPSNL